MDFANNPSNPNQSPLQPEAPIPPQPQPQPVVTAAPPAPKLPVAPAPQASVSPSMPEAGAQPPVVPSPVSASSEPVTPASPPVNPSFSEPAPLSPMAQMSSTRKSKLPIIIAGVVLLLLVGVTTALAGHKSNIKTSTVAAIKPTEQPPTDTDTTTNTKAATTTPAKTVKAVNAVLSNPNLGYSITATNVVINPFAFPDRYKSFGEGKVIVLVQYAAVASTKYTGSPVGQDVFLVDASGEATPDSTSNYTAEMQANNYTPGPFTISIGKTVTGYEAYAVDSSKVSTLGIQYKQHAVKIINGGQTYPEQTFSAKLF